ncbi:hypothetical protein BC629DRAFT_1091959 [Irpex lacteus]|nr:hypothetical protein BC629DRAFT_1091959 [Irpex lacteus]
MCTCIPRFPHNYSHNSLVMGFPSPLLCIALVLVNYGAAQNFGVPSNWRKPTSTHTRQELLDLITGLLNTVERTLNATSGQFIGLMPLQSASMASALTIGDALNGSKTNENLVGSSLNTFRSFENMTNMENPPTTNDDSAIWGLAALDAYNTYKDSEFLGYAISMWTQLHRYMITSSQAAVEPATHPTRTVNFLGVCNGVSNAGAVFYMSGTSGDARVDGQTTTAFMA